MGGQERLNENDLGGVLFIIINKDAKVGAVSPLPLPTTLGWGVFWKGHELYQKKLLLCHKMCSRYNIQYLLNKIKEILLSCCICKSH